MSDWSLLTWFTYFLFGLICFVAGIHIQKRIVPNNEEEKEEKEKSSRCLNCGYEYTAP